MRERGEEAGFLAVAAAAASDFKAERGRAEGMLGILSGKW